jgi:hypothetical protein
MKSNAIIITLILLLSTVGCSQTSKYVTSIQPAGTSGLIIEKCETEFNPFTSKVSTGDCSQSYVQIGNPGASSGTVPVQLNNNVK